MTARYRGTEFSYAHAIPERVFSLLFNELTERAVGGLR
jgi:hypothetical protein